MLYFSMSLDSGHINLLVLFIIIYWKYWKIYFRIIWGNGNSCCFHHIVILYKFTKSLFRNIFLFLLLFVYPAEILQIKNIPNSFLCVGYYLSAQLWSHPVGSRGTMMTAVMEPTPPDGECLMFWYYMEGSGVGELSVYLQTHDMYRNRVHLWNRRGDQGTHWRHGRVTLFSPDTSYQVGSHLWVVDL